MTALATLDADGVRAFDPAARALIGALLGRAEALGERAGKKLRARAEVRISLLGQAFASARARATNALSMLPGDAPSRPLLARALAAGDLTTVLFQARRYVRRSGSDLASAARLSKQSDAAARYERSFSELFAALDVARALDTLPEAAGPYNALTLAARTLGELGSLSPAYLRAQVMRLEDLGALIGLPPAPSLPIGRSRRRTR